MLSAPRQLEIFIPCLFAICLFTICPLQSTLFNLPFAIYPLQYSPFNLPLACLQSAPLQYAHLQSAPLQSVSCNLPLCNLSLAICPSQSMHTIYSLLYSPFNLPLACRLPLCNIRFLQSAPLQSAPLCSASFNLPLSMYLLLAICPLKAYIFDREQSSKVLKEALLLLFLLLLGGIILKGIKMFAMEQKMF